MAWQDRLKNVAKNLAGATGSALIDYAEDPLTKADLALQGQDDQDDAPGGSHPDTAMDNPVPDEQSTDDPKSLFWDPFAIIEQLGYKERPSSVTYGTLKAMVWKTPIIHAIIQTRIQQMASFCQPAKDRYDMGYRVQLRDTKREPSPEDKKWSQQAETMILRTGVTDNPRGRDTFEKFVRKTMWDSLVYDQLTWEIVPNKRGEPAEWYAVDASTIRLADTASTFLNEDNTEAVRYVQIYDGMIISEYTQKELCFGVRNPRTDIRLFGYGVSEIEMLMNVITAILFSWTYNQSAFSQGTSQKGILNFKGAIPERQLKAFRRHWYQMVSGVENCLSGDTLIWTPKGGLPISAVIGDKPEVETRVWTGDSWKSALVYRTKEPKKLCHTTLNNGVTVSTSPDHKFRVIGDDGEPTWKRQQELQIGDFVLVNRKLVEDPEVTLPAYKGKTVTPELMEVLGWSIRDGHFSPDRTVYLKCFYSEHELGIRARHHAILAEFEPDTVCREIHFSEEKCESLCEEFGFDSVRGVYYRIDMLSKDFAQWLVSLGFTASKRATGGKSVPPFVHVLPFEYKRSFLRGMFSADGSNSRLRDPAIAITDDKMRGQTKHLLLSLGIRTIFYEGGPKKQLSGRDRMLVNKKSFLKIKDKDRFFELIGFDQAHKQPTELLRSYERNRGNGIAPATVLKYMRKVREANNATGQTLLTYHQRKNLNCILTGQDRCSHGRLVGFLEMAKLPVPQWLQDYYFEPVVAIENTEQLVPMFDLSVSDDEHRFMGNGVYLSNSWRTPITNAEELQWISMQNSNRDMEYSAWMDFLIKVSCGILTIDPVEINFKYGNTGQRAQMNEAANKDKITESKERGLRPLLRFLETQINQYIIWPLNESFEFKFAGLDSKTREEMADLNTKLVKTVRTIDELRAEDNLPPLPEGKGEIILDPTWLQFASGKDQMAQQGAGAPGGDAQPGADGQGDGMDFQQLLAEQEADEADDDDDDADQELADEQEATAKSLLQKSFRKAKRLHLDLKL